MKANRYAIVVAAGSGKRMGAPLPKQFLTIAGKPMLIHTLERLHSFDSNMHLVLVLHPDYFSFWKALTEEYRFIVPHTIVAGGQERFHSVKNAIDFIQDESAVVGIHDAARPLVSIDTLVRCFETAEQKGNAVPVIALNDSLRVVNDGGNSAVERSLYRLVQTPQCFAMNILRAAFDKPYQPLFTDDASVVESIGHTIHLVEGNRENLKITTAEDLRWAEWQLTT
ncbi:MAG: 2-C-methyl-D-erythritol 4-phosphate cytidylyltransferase [Flavobacteriales bacterium]|jgi:2-C-methyl-D-erythritol 4-phosphate cytidylyltransferase